MNSVLCMSARSYLHTHFARNNTIHLVTESHAVTITTFAKDRVQQRSNYSNSPRDEYQLSEEKAYFTQGPENVVIKVLLIN